MESIISKYSNKKENTFKIDNPDSLVRIHHILMKEYGWIPVKEFGELPIKTCWNLLDCIKKQHDGEEKRMNKGKHRVRKR